VEFYTHAIYLQPTNAATYINRAQAKLKLGQWQPALVDCNKAVALNQASFQAYYKRSQARQALGDYKVGSGRPLGPGGKRGDTGMAHVTGGVGHGTQEADGTAQYIMMLHVGVLQLSLACVRAMGGGGVDAWQRGNAATA
jgi:tetratricopeptide (TPR) repeat protein